MFESFYGMTRTPFSRDIPTDHLYQSTMLEETLGRLNYAAQRQMFAVVTGDCGTGNSVKLWTFNTVYRWTLCSGSNSGAFISSMFPANVLLSECIPCRWSPGMFRPAFRIYR